MQGLEIFFYCSYKLSGGFKYTKVNLEENETIRLNKDNNSLIPSFVRKAFDTGSADMLLGQSGGKYYTVVKRIEYVDPNKGEDEMGRKVSANVAFASDDCEKIVRLTKFIVSDYPEWCDEISKVVIPNPKMESGYEINYEKLSAILKIMLEKELPEIPAELKKYTNLMDGFKTDYGFVVLSSDIDYFMDMFKASDQQAPKKIFIEKNAFKNAHKQKIKYLAENMENTNNTGDVNNTKDVNDTNDVKNTKDNVNEQDSGLKRKLEAAERQIEELKNKLAEAKGKIARLESNIAPPDGKTRELENKLAEAKGKIMSLESSLSSSRRQMLIGGIVALVLIIILFIKGCAN